MPIRTVQIQGQGYGSTPAQITVTANATTVFSGTVSTVDQALPSLPNPAINLSNVLCTFEIDTAFVGSIPMTCAVSTGAVIFAKILANYVSIPNPVYTPAQIATLSNSGTTQVQRVEIYTPVAVPALTQAEIDVLLNPTPSPEQNDVIIAHNLSTYTLGPDTYGPIDNTDPRSTVVIDGIAQTPDHGELAGTWWWTINAGSTMTYQLDVDPAAV